MDIRQALTWLDSHTNLEGASASKSNLRAPTGPMPNAGDVGGLSLAPMTDLLAAVGDPHRAYRVIHVTGTNGKGSTTRFISALLGASGLSVGTYTSPNISRINERVVWDGREITDEELAEVLTLLAEVVPLLARRPSRFELLTAAAFIWFAQQGTEVAVVEVGLLGRFDATNVVTPDVAVITNIGKDHTDGAPGWRRQVAWEKAGIIKPGSRVVLGTAMGELRPIFDAEPSAGVIEADTDFEVVSNLVAVAGRAVDVRTPDSAFDQVHLPFHGAHQGDNLATALAAVEQFFGRSIAQDLVEEALATVELPGRFEIVGRMPTVVLDGAHNPDGARAAKATLDDEFARLGSWVLVMGMLGGKDPVEMLEAVGARDFDAVIITEPAWTRALPARELAEAARGMGIDVEVVPNVIRAFDRARMVTTDDDLVLVTGSMYVVGEVRSHALAVSLER